MTVADEKHPADTIGKSLSRASGILASLANCYDRGDADFEISLPFIFEAVSTVEKLLANASASLGSLYEGYDLSKLPTKEVEVVLSAVAEARAENIAEMNLPSSSRNETRFEISIAGQDDTVTTPESQMPNYLENFGPTVQVSKLASRLDTILGAMPARNEPAKPEDMLDRPAQNYDEFLEKLTAMADAAYYQAHRTSDTENVLLPVLEVLRADMLRLRSVA